MKFPSHSTISFVPSRQQTENLHKYPFHGSLPLHIFHIPGDRYLLHLFPTLASILSFPTFGYSIPLPSFLPSFPFSRFRVLPFPFAPKWISLIKRLLSTRFRVLPFLSETSFRLPPSFPFPEQVFACFFPETRFRVLFPLPKIGSSPVHRTRSNNRQGSDSTNPVERNRQPLRKPTINSDSTRKPDRKPTINSDST